jgi:hypothetical protein
VNGSPWPFASFAKPEDDIGFGSCELGVDEELWLALDASGEADFCAIGWVGIGLAALPGKERLTSHVLSDDGLHVARSFGGGDRLGGVDGAHVLH